MMARVLVSFTIVAASRVLLPCMPSQAEAAAVTEEVSLMAVPANSPKPSLESPKAEPKAGKSRAAMMLKKKMTEMDWAISLSSASITGAVAAMAEPPQMDEPTPIKIEVLPGSFNARDRMKAITREVVMVARMIGRASLPF